MPLGQGHIQGQTSNISEIPIFYSIRLIFLLGYRIKHTLLHIRMLYSKFINLFQIVDLGVIILNIN